MEGFDTPGPENTTYGLSAMKDIEGPRSIPVIQKIDNQIKELEGRIQQLRRVREILDKNPEIHELLTLLRRVAI